MSKPRFDYSSIKIERDIEMPNKGYRGSSTMAILKWLPKLRVGDSFVIDKMGMYGTIVSVAQKSGMRLRLRNVSTEMKQEYRIWRVA